MIAYSLWEKAEVVTFSLFTIQLKIKLKNIQTESKLPPHGSGLFYRTKKVKEIANYFDLLIGGNQIWN